MNGSHRQLERSRTDRWLAGICGGIGSYLGVSSLLIRLLFLVSLAVTGGASFLIYVVLWVVLPVEGTQSQDPVKENLDEMRVEAERWAQRIRVWLQSLGLLRNR